MIQLPSLAEEAAHQAEYAARMHSGLTLDGLDGLDRKTWLRISVTDAMGRCDPLIKEAEAGRRPIPWFSKWHRDDALRALPSLAASKAEYVRLYDWIAKTAFTGRKLGSWIEFAHYSSERGIFYRSRAVWPEPAVNSASMLELVAAIADRRGQPGPILPIISEDALTAWRDYWPDLEAEATWQNSPLDLATCWKAIRRHPFLQ